MLDTPTCPVIARKQVTWVDALTISCVMCSFVCAYSYAHRLAEGLPGFIYQEDAEVVEQQKLKGCIPDESQAPATLYGNLESAQVVLIMKGCERPSSEHHGADLMQRCGGLGWGVCACLRDRVSARYKPGCLCACVPLHVLWPELIGSVLEQRWCFVSIIS